MFRASKSRTIKFIRNCDRNYYSLICTSLQPCPMWIDLTVQLNNLCNEKLTLDTIEMYDEPIALFTGVVCNIANGCIFVY